MPAGGFDWSFILDQAASSSAVASLRLEKVEVQYVNGIAVAPSDMVQRGIARWEKTLVGFFVGKKLGFPTVKKHLESRWGLREPLEMWLDQNLFYIKTGNDKLKERILNGGPIFIMGRVFVIQKWSLELEEQRDKIASVPVWAKLWHLPKELIGEEDDDVGISFTASLISTPYSMDINTKRRRKVDCCRVCLLVSAEQEFPTEIQVDVGRLATFRVEYEWLPPTCKRCKNFGHKTEVCEVGPSENPTAENRVQYQDKAQSEQVSYQSDRDLGGRHPREDWHIVPARASSSPMELVASVDMAIVSFTQEPVATDDNVVSPLVEVEADNEGIMSNRFNALLECSKEGGSYS